MENKFSETIPESSETIDLQLDALRRGRGKAVLITPGTEMPGVPKLMRSLGSDVGTWIFNPMKVKASTIKKKVEDGTFGELLGHVEPKNRDSDSIVSAIQDGIEAKSSVTSKKSLMRQANELRRQFPDAEIIAGGPEQALRILEQRISES